MIISYLPHTESNIFFQLLSYFLLFIIPLLKFSLPLASVELHSPVSSPTSLFPYPKPVSLVLPLSSYSPFTVSSSKQCYQKQPLCPSTKLNHTDRVLHEVERNSFIALPGKGEHSRLMPLRKHVF